MKKLLLILMLPFTALGQTNLVPNSSFEDTVNCPNFNSYSSSTSPGGNMFDVKDWHGDNMLSPDYYHECTGFSTFSIPSNSAGFQYARSGEAYCGIFAFAYSPNQNLDMREYIYVKLDEENALKEDALYRVGFYFSASDFYSRITTYMGMQFSNIPLDSTLTIPPYNPNYTVMDTNCIDSVNIDDWILVEDIYQAKGDEIYLTIGCFKSTPNVLSTLLTNNNSSGAFYSTYIYIDDVFVIPLDSPVTYNCLANACIDPQDGSGLYDSLATCQAICNATAIEENNSTKQLLKITDVLGRESKPTPNVPLFYRYDDGTVEKRIVVE
jgi:hypothetical protein